VSESREHRRKAKRYPARWKAAVVFEKPDERPILHTETVDLSAGGAAILSEYPDLTGSTVTLLLARPPRQGEDAPKMLKLRARVLSSVPTRNQPRVRHGLRFVQAGEQDLALLEELLRTAAPAEARAPEPPPAAPSRLARLKELAQAKLADESRPDPKEEMRQQVNDALVRAHTYLKELVEQLNVVKPAFAGKGYAIAGVPEFAGLAWASGRVDFRTREIAPQKKVYEQVSLSYRFAGGKPIRIARESPASERLKQLLKDNRIEFTTDETRNERGAIERTTFAFACEVRASLALDGDYEAGRIVLRGRNAERFGLLEQRLAPEAITEASLEELAAFILGETPRLGPLLLKGA
jgi:hypothetical protein